MSVKVGLYDIYILLISVSKGLGLDAAHPLYVAIFSLGCFVLLVKIFHEKYLVRELIPMLLFAAIGILNLLAGRTAFLLSTVVTLCGLKHVDIDKALRIALWGRLSAFLCMILGSILGILNNTPLLFFRSGKIITRYPFGYSHPNRTHMELAIVILLVLYLYGRRMRFPHYLALLGINSLLYKFTYSRTGFYVIILSVLLFLFGKNYKFRKISVGVMRHGYWCLFLITLAMGLLYGKLEILYALDRLLTGRIYYLHRLFTSFLPPMIGTEEYSAYVNFDNGYAAMLYCGGLPAFFWLSYYITKVSKKLYASKAYERSMLMFCFMVYGMAEMFYPIASENLSLLFIGEVLFQNGGKHENKGADNFHAGLQQAGPFAASIHVHPEPDR